MNIEQILPCSSTYEKTYHSKINIGQDFLKNKKIVIVGLVRNLEKVLPKNIEKLILTFNKKCKEYKIVLFENDSSDKTIEILKDISSTNKNIVYYSHIFNRQQYGPTKEKERTIALAEYRNFLLEKIKKEYSDYDYTVVCDMDFVDFSDLGCYNSFGWFATENGIDAIAGNSFELKKLYSDSASLSLWNYDSWAFRFTWWNYIDNPGQYTRHDPMLWFGFFIPPVGSSLFPINSAFGGMVIYKTQKFINGNYDGNDCEHVLFHYSLKQNNPSFNFYLNPSQIMLV